MNIRDYVARLEKAKVLISDKAGFSKRIEVTTGVRLLAEYKNRIFKNGLTTNLKKIGRYKGKPPIYINPKGRELKGVKKSGFKPLGKNSKNRFKNGNKKKTRYIPDGWAGVRALAGRQTGFVDLNFSSASFASIQLGFLSGRLVLGSTSKIRGLILRGMEKRFKKRILSLSLQERAAWGFAYRAELSKIIKEAINGGN